MVASRLVGSILAGKYRVERVLHEGGAGVVLAARHIEMEETVAVKLLREHASGDAEQVAGFIDEAKASARVRSDHVVRVRDAARLPDGRTYLVMELLEGLDLAQALARDGPMSVSVAVDHVLQASEAIAEAHSMGLVHRALRPSSLFLTRRRNGKACVKVLDFGISRLLDADDVKETSTADVVGAPLYRSPEQIVSAADVDARADVWSMGVVLYELLVGRTPFHATSLAELRHAILQQPAPDVRGRRPDVPAQVAEAIAAALAKRREERTASIAELATALAPFASPVGREAFDALKATAARHLAPAPSVRMPVSSAQAPPSSPEPVTVGAPAGAAAPVVAATQGTLIASPQPRSKGVPLVAALLAAFGVLAAVGVLGIAWTLMSRRAASAAPSAPSAPAAPSAVAAPPPVPPAQSSTPTTENLDDPPAPSAAPSTSSASPPATKTPAPRGTSKGRPRPHGGRR